MGAANKQRRQIVALVNSITYEKFSLTPAFCSAVVKFSQLWIHMRVTAEVSKSDATHTHTPARTTTVTTIATTNLTVTASST